MSYKLLNTITILLLLSGVVIIALGWLSFWTVLGFGFLYVLFLLIVSTNVRLNFFVKSFNSRPKIKERSVALTFDDGPVENTLRILDILDKYGVKAGFFCIGKNIEANSEILKAIIERGHIVGNHSFSHTRKMGFLSSEKIINEIIQCDEIVEKTTGLKMNLFRPPFGVINPKTQKALNFTGHKVVGWNLRSYDAILNSKQFILKRIIRNIKPGDVILLHDNKIQSVEILEQLLLFLLKNQYSVVRPDVLFNIDAYS